jgi:hypothetical protein
MIPYFFWPQIGIYIQISIYLVAAAQKDKNNVLYQCENRMAHSGYDVVLKT